MRICYLADADSSHTKKWVDYFSSLDNEIYLISMRGTQYKYKDNVKLIVVKPPEGSKLMYFSNLSKIKKLVNEINPDILHSHYATSYGLFGRYTRKHPFIISVWGSDVYLFPSNKPKAMLLSYILRGADLVCSTSHDMAEVTSRYYKNDIRVTPFGVDTERFKSTRAPFSEAIVTIGAVKGLEEVYGIDYLIEGFAKLVKEKDYAKYVRLMIVGDGTKRDELEKLSKDMGVSELVTFTGRVDNKDVPEYINKCDIICVPSLSESFGVTAVEACSCERCVISTNVGGLKEVIKDGYNGIIVRQKNSDDIKVAIEKLLCDKDNAIMMGRNGRKYTLDNYDWNKNAEEMKKIYESMIIK